MPEHAGVYMVKRMIRGYAKGTYTPAEIFHFVVDHVNRTNVSEVLADAPHEVLADIHQRANEYPHSDEEWAATRFISINRPPSNPHERDGAIGDDERLRLRAAVECIRDYFRTKAS